MKKILLVLLILLGAQVAQAQNPTNVTGTIVDPNSIPYYPGTVTACLNPTTTDPIVGGKHVNNNIGAPYCIGPVQTNPAGGFSMGLFANANITPAATTWIFTVQAVGSAAPAGTGPQNFQSSGITIAGASQDVSATLSALAPKLLNSGSTGLPSQAGYDATLSGVIPNQGKVCFDGTLTTSSNVITSAGQCQWTSADIGSIIFVTNVCTPGQCGFTNYVASITVFPSTQITTARISGINSATSINTDCNAPANCAVANPSAVLCSPQCVIVYGTKQTTQLNNAWTAANAIATINVCPDLELPPGIFLFDGPVFTDAQVPAGTKCGKAPTNLKTIAQLTYPNVGPRINGKGMGTTILVPTPDFNWLGAGGCSTQTYAQAIGGVDGLIFTDWSVMGFGQSLLISGVGSGCQSLVAMTSGYMARFHGEGWANSTLAACNGFALGNGVGYGVVSDSSFIAFGGGPNNGCGTVHATGDNNQVSQTVMIGAGAYSSLINDATLLELVNITYGPPSRTNNPSIVNSGIFQDVNSRCEGSGTSYSQTVGTAIIQNKATGNMFLTNFANQCSQNGSGSLDITNASGGFVDVEQFKSTVTNTNGVSNAGTFYDHAPSKFSGTAINTGTWIGHGSAQIAPLVVGNIGLTSGWGTSSVSSVGPNGDSVAGVFTITAAGAPGASPTITLTFPTAYQVPAKFCTLQQIGGTLGVLTVPLNSAGTPTVTSVLFTLSGTAVATQTYTFSFACQ